MPKRIENIREMLLLEARRQAEENGYGAVTVRSVAGACGLGTGTVYNYFSSKDMLIATFILEDWEKSLSEMRGSALCGIEKIELVFSLLARFSSEHSYIFSDSTAEKSFADSFFKWHPHLRMQISEIILPECKGDKLLSEFLAEAIVTWSCEGKKFSELSAIIIKLLK